MKKLIINESQKERLFEAYSEGFSLEKLSLIGRGQFSLQDNSKAQVKYCKKYLGPMQNQGSSRCTFTINDGLILKLAYNGQGLWEAGIAQNEAEYDLHMKVNSPLLPRILYHDEDFQFIVCESVLPATETDFEKYLGMPFYGVYRQHTMKQPLTNKPGDKEVGFDKYFEKLKAYKEADEIPVIELLSYIQSKYYIGSETSKEYEKIIKKSWWLKELVKLSKIGVSDISSIDNYGIVNRDGKPIIVLLDSGFNKEVYYKYYL